MADKFFTNSNGRLALREASDLSTGPTNDGDIVALDSTGKLAMSMLPTDLGGDLVTVIASETISAGSFINLFSSAGNIRARNASANAIDREAVGFVLVGGINGQALDVYVEGVNDQLSGLTIGARYYLHTLTSGSITDTPPTGSGNVVQYVGRAISATELAFEPDEGFILD